MTGEQQFWLAIIQAVLALVTLVVTPLVGWWITSMNKKLAQQSSDQKTEIAEQTRSDIAEVAKAVDDIKEAKS